MEDTSLKRRVSQFLWSPGLIAQKLCEDDDSWRLSAITVMENGGFVHSEHFSNGIWEVNFVQAGTLRYCGASMDRAGATAIALEKVRANGTAVLPV